MKIFTLAACLVFLATTVMAQGVTPGSVWVNTGGSILTIDSIDADGSIAGTYVNKVQGFQCQNEPMTVSGWIKGNLLSFSVRWQNANVDCNSITSWTGYESSGQIFTDWDLIYIAAGTGQPTHLKKSNVFTKQ